ncbi:MAG: hypothetical protein M3N42_17985, partial [Cyanobacteriota bacterium]|nr:hypothetical protein [Cyanobacteriota bacterium]
MPASKFLPMSPRNADRRTESLIFELMKFLSPLGDCILSGGILSPGFPISRNILFWFCNCSRLRGWLRSGKSDRALSNRDLSLGNIGGEFELLGLGGLGGVIGGFIGGVTGGVI